MLLEELSDVLDELVAVDVGELLHEGLVAGDLFEIDEDEFDLDSLRAVLNEFAEDGRDLDEVLLERSWFPLARQDRHQPQRVLLRQVLERTVLIRDVLQQVTQVHVEHSFAGVSAEVDERLHG